MTSKVVIEVRYLEDQAGAHQTKKTYHYFLPKTLVPSTKTGDLVVVKSAHTGWLMLARIVGTVPADASRAHLASRSIVAVVDMERHDREEAAAKRKKELLAGLEALERKRQETIRFETLARDNADAAAMLTELKTLEDA